MAANATLQRVHEQGWRRGFANTFRKENRDWWGTRRWWVAILIWSVLVNGALAATLSSSSADAPAELIGMAQFLQMSVITTLIGAITIMQNTLIDEKKTGTAEWILSKPVSRSAFVLSKFAANAIALLLIAIVLQGVLAYVQLSAKTGAALAVMPFVVSLGIIALQMLLFISLPLMLGAFFNSRGAVLGVPLALVFIVMVVSNFVPSIVQVAPFSFGLTTGPADPMLAAVALQAQPLPTLLPLISTAVWTVLFLAVALRTRRVLEAGRSAALFKNRPQVSLEETWGLSNVVMRSHHPCQNPQGTRTASRRVGSHTHRQLSNSLGCRQPWGSCSDPQGC